MLEPEAGRAAGEWEAVRDGSGERALLERDMARKQYESLRSAWPTHGRAAPSGCAGRELA